MRHSAINSWSWVKPQLSILLLIYLPIIFLIDLWIIWALKYMKIVKSDLHNFLKLKLTSKDIQITMTYDKQKQEIIKSEEL